MKLNQSVPFHDTAGGRIRTLKSELPHHESIGRLSRDARLLLLMLFTVADDYGHARAATRMLASLLYPYDADAPERIEGWLIELEEQRLYDIRVSGVEYRQQYRFVRLGSEDFVVVPGRRMTEE